MDEFFYYYLPVAAMSFIAMLVGVARSVRYRRMSRLVFGSQCVVKDRRFRWHHYLYLGLTTITATLGLAVILAALLPN